MSGLGVVVALDPLLDSSGGGDLLTVSRVVSRAETSVSPFNEGDLGLRQVDRPSAAVDRPNAPVNFGILAGRLAFGPVVFEALNLVLGNATRNLCFAL